jgi:hypothetical protein
MPLPTPASVRAQAVVPGQEITSEAKENDQYDSSSEESSVDGEYRPPIQAGNQDDDHDDGDSEEEDQLTSEPTMPKKRSGTSSRNKKAPAEASQSVAKGEKQRGGKASKNGKKSRKTGAVSNTLELVPYVPADTSLLGGVGSGDDDGEDLGAKDPTIPDEEAFRMARAAGVGQEAQFTDDSLRSGWDWTKLQQCWVPRSGPPSNIAIEQIRSLTSQFAYHLYDIAAGSGLSQARMEGTHCVS